jgi:Protein of unknown function (DUF1003)
MQPLAQADQRRRPGRRPRTQDSSQCQRRSDQVPARCPIVSLEAIFLSTFVMISQNRADEKRQVLADHQWQTVQEEEQQNEDLLHISNQILELTEAIHKMAAAQSPARSSGSDGT